MCANIDINIYKLRVQCRKEPITIDYSATKTYIQSKFSLVLCRYIILIRVTNSTIFQIIVINSMGKKNKTLGTVK